MTMKEQVIQYSGATATIHGIDDLGHRIVELKIQSGEVTYILNMNIKQASQLGLLLLSPKKE